MDIGFRRRNGGAAEKNPDGDVYRGRSGAHPRLDEMDYAPPEKRAAEEAIRAMNRKNDDQDGPRIDLADLGRKTAIDPIAEIQLLTRGLTYGEMMTLAEMLAGAMTSTDIDKEKFKYILPPTLHKFATAVFEETP